MDQLAVEFCADTGGTFPMTWGQQAFWQQEVATYSEEVQNFNIPMVVDLPATTSPAGQATVTAVTAALRRLIERNQSLRAHFLDGPSGPLQRIARAGTFNLRVCHTTPQDSRARADALAAGLATANFDHETEWGLHIGLVCAGQVPCHVAFGFSHLMIDGGGIRALIDDFLGLLNGSEPPLPWQPADQVRREQSPRSARRSRAAIEYWRKQFNRIPVSMFPGPAGPAARPRFHRLRLDSRVLAAVAPRLAAGCQVSVPSVVLAGLALALTALTGRPICALRVVSSNRHDEDLRSMVGAAAQHGLFAVSLPGGTGRTVAEAVRTTHRAARSAYFYAYYNPAALQELRGELAAQRGVQFGLDSIYNDLSGFLDPADEAAPARISEAGARKLLADSVIVPEETWEGQHCMMYLEALPGRDGCSLTLVADSVYLPLPTMRTLLRGIETIVLEAAYRDVAVSDIPVLTGLRPAPGGPLPS
ncbi:MAG TPA: condensation domain-containing protein [Streptosporangiaceae bacterium]